MKEITLYCEIPEDVSSEELEQFLAFKFMGHSISDKVLEKFCHEELDVDHITIK